MTNVVVINMFSHVLVTLILCLFLFGCSAVECELYLAESTIPNAGLGIFSAIERNPGDVFGAGDVCLPLYDPKSHHDDPFNPFLSGTPSLFDRFEYLFHSLLTLCHSQGLGSAINCNLALVNLDKSDLRYDAGGLHRALHPGAGAITPYYNWTNEVKRKIPVGGELFKVHNL
jgi:hypothetical protein